ncbi:(2Fe-2S) ferredoxin domain-containing protein [Laspinema olomoucense]|uniref:(2Fe-2S) ferredoxin domain-containing protein n=1 Tax=Laspinema olomoucense D3b TaxID=2953688 RepID=A0ABT2N6F5_9CYAN|nr:MULTISPECIES: (2Fe-2S) ferredoxin domain-containing protein [unclassified Laspinema]MCT7973304.1 (2Fe-2S) ferredoxin domain-containing protein [Laspinema sp. D3d]MCT7977310.1 (2Fe-2S) ferredoxin domain-containing protein [Laspinema sp. D3b]MCT7990775.1 (2Fe-2S) ferredoxin domain-containing protein [Laspinema sp. D3a]MCT7995484.1 (2Fe-2S) ferredoxin domain-containing protein [Laspinema sp. D3c]
MTKENLYLCMGSACHQLGVYEVLPRLQELIIRYELKEKIELKGSFCLETCSVGIVMKFKEKVFTKITPENIEAKFSEEILPSILAVVE